MIISCKDKATEDIYNGIRSKRALRALPVELHRKVWRKLDMLRRAQSLTDLRIPPSNRLEALKGDLRGFWSIRINGQYRVVFAWRDGHAHEVWITDYH